MTDFIKNDAFFEEKANNIPYVGMVSPVVEINTDYYKKYSESELEIFRQRYYTMLEKYLKLKIDAEKMSTYLEILFELQFVNVLLSIGIKDRKLPVLPFTSTCIPGMKISVRPDGKFDMCEKINQTFPIGDLEAGLDIKAITSIVKNYNEKIGSSCVDCPINRMCGICYSQVCGNGIFEKPNCQAILDSFKFNLSIIYTVLEKNPHAFDAYFYRDEWILNS